MYKLVIQDDEGKTTVVPLIRDELTIGRKEGNTIRLTERNVSRQHARLTRANGTIVIEDLNSYNGIRVNGSRIQGRATIKESDRVQIGDYLIEVRSDAIAEAGTSQDETQPLERVEGTSPPATVPSMAVPTAEGTSPGAIPSVAPEPVALADTDPGRATGASVSNHGRLVILSTNFAGQEFVLDKPKLVIGRTDDNDIWLNHRSISRHHAKVLFENGRYSIEDNQSSNGVRVNGEEYGKVELRRADVIDLGHVRLRFIEPGEDFVFGRDAQAVDVAPYSGGRTWLWVALAGAALVAMIVVFFAMNGGDKSNAGNGEGTGTGTALSGTNTGTNNVVQPDIPDAAPEADVDAAVDPDAENKANALKNLAEAKRFLASNQLSEARVAIDTAKSLDPENPDILAVSKEIESRLDQSDAADANWARFMTAVNNAQRPAEARKVRTMADDFGGTKYAEQVDAQVRKAKANYRRALVAKARRAKDCDERDRIASGAVWPDLRDDVKRLKCKSAPTPGTGTGSDSDGGSDSGADKQKQYQSDIQEVSNGGSLTKAYAACAKVRGSTWVKKCLVMACRNQNRSKAQQYLARLPKGSRDKFINLCMAQGVPLP